MPRARGIPSSEANRHFAQGDPTWYVWGTLMKRRVLTSTAAQFTANVRGYTVDDEDLLCLDLVMDFRPGRRFGLF